MDEFAEQMRDLIAQLQEHGENPTAVAAMTAFAGVMERERQMITALATVTELVGQVHRNCEALVVRVEALEARA